jgi:hypothetical protein
MYDFSTDAYAKSQKKKRLGDKFGARRQELTLHGQQMVEGSI